MESKTGFGRRLSPLCEWSLRGEKDIKWKARWGIPDYIAARTPHYYDFCCLQSVPTYGVYNRILWQIAYGDSFNILSLYKSNIKCRILWQTASCDTFVIPHVSQYPIITVCTCTTMSCNLCFYGEMCNLGNSEEKGAHSPLALPPSDSSIQIRKSIRRSLTHYEVFTSSQNIVACDSSVLLFLLPGKWELLFTKYFTVGLSAPSSQCSDKRLIWLSAVFCP